MTNREKIFEAGVKLFAERAYDSVGIREIAKEAGVNSAMISYYYKGKSGLLREIFSTYEAKFSLVNDQILREAISFDDLCELSVKGFLTIARENRSLFMIGLRMFNSESEHISDLRHSLRQKIHSGFSEFLERIGAEDSRNKQESEMVFTAVLGTVFSDYLLGGGKYIDDDECMESYAQIIVAMLQGAMKRLVG